MNLKQQNGAATLLVTVVLLALITLVSIYITKIGLLETKTSANANRAKEALHNAQAGLDFGAINVQVSGASWADGTVYDVPMLSNASVSVRGFESGGVMTVQAIGESIDNTGQANVTESYGRFPLTAFGELPPLMSNGNFPPNGGFTIVTNPNGSGTGVKVSAWVETTVDASTGTWQTCSYDEFYNQGIPPGGWDATVDEDGDGVIDFIRCDDCSCDNNTENLCNREDTTFPSDCPDIIADANIPDTFENLFGQPGADWEAFMNAYAEPMTCAEVRAAGATVGDQFYDGGGNPTTLPLIWVENGGTECRFQEQIGSYEKPVILFMHGDVRMNATGVIFGILFVFSDTYNLTETYDITMNGGANVYGVVLINREVDLGNGGFNLIYNQKILDRISNEDNGGFFGLGRRSGSWTDFN
ncbi:MAG: hypothetical protein ACRBB6_13570 [Neptuniibacter sp.]